MKKIILFTTLAIFLGTGLYQGYKFLTDRGRKTTTPEYTDLSGQYQDGKLSYLDVSMGFSPEFEYLGGQKFVLYGTADVEQHFFAKPNPEGGTESVVFIQFEKFRPDIEGQFDYSSSPLREQVGEFDFYVDTFIWHRHPIWKYGRPGSDGYMSRKFVASKGFPAPKEYTYARLVHLPTEGRREEILIVYMDDLSPTGYRSKDFASGGRHEALLSEMSDAHLAKLKAAFWIEQVQ